MEITAFLTTDEAHALGRKYAQAGLKLTPHDCKPIDDAIFEQISGLTGTARCKAYNALRGAFNHGWNQAYAAQEPNHDH
ncbi:MAG: hypothetical protein WBA65_14175 [Rhodanobacter sp.]|uniref:hypothetical protein n=1 Tax=Castellaniella sp. TaxID=1955812 RepID=UPI003C793F78